MSGWIGVDLDGTLAHYDKWRGMDHIGDPIPKMLDRVQKWVDSGIEVRIFTARVHEPEALPFIEDWLDKHGLGCLKVTNRVIPNTGVPCCGQEEVTQIVNQE